MQANWQALLVKQIFQNFILSPTFTALGRTKATGTFSQLHILFYHVHYQRIRTPGNEKGQ